jgi:predicted DNA-binding transcriptional regulator AlpA
MEAKYLRIPAVLQRYGIGRTTIYDLVAKSEFPRPIHVGRSALWSIDELARFEDAKALEREPGAPGDMGWRESPSASTPSGVLGAGG